MKVWERSGKSILRYLANKPVTEQQKKKKKKKKKNKKAKTIYMHLHADINILGYKIAKQIFQICFVAQKHSEFQKTSYTLGHHALVPLANQIRLYEASTNHK